jgi:hypothetical protein
LVCIDSLFASLSARLRPSFLSVEIFSSAPAPAFYGKNQSLFQGSNRIIFKLASLKHCYVYGFYDRRKIFLGGNHPERSMSKRLQRIVFFGVLMCWTWSLAGLWRTTWKEIIQQDGVPNPKANGPSLNVVQFLFGVGLEGTGHHLVGRIVSASPSYYRLKHALPDYRRDMRDLHNALFDGRYNDGVWNLPCHGRNNRSIEHKMKDGVLRLANVLRRVEDHAKTSNRSDGKSIIFPLNTITIDKDDKVSYGEASYPNFGGSCRVENYPRLSSLYHACEMASVECRHVYLYRDPLEILYSTTVNRKFNLNLSQGLTLYETILRGAILPELASYRDQSLGCLGFYEGDPMHWKAKMSWLGQWQNQSKLEDAMERIYHPPSRNRTDLETTTISLFTGEDWTIYDSWKGTHNDILQSLC